MTATATATPKPRRPLHTQFVRWLLLPMVLAFGLAAWLTAAINYHTEKQHDAALRAQTLDAFAHALSKPLWDCDSATVAGIVQALAQQPQVRGVLLDDACAVATVAAGAPQGSAQQPLPDDSLRARLSHHDALGREYAVGQLYIEFAPPSVTSAALRGLWQQLAVFGVVLAVVLAGAVLVFRRIIGRPLTHFRQAILAHHTVHDHNPPPSRVADELDDVTRAYDELVHTLQRLARHDPLTGLGNRMLLEERLGHALERAARQGSRVGVLLLDLDGFKPINDTHGHAVGDAVLQAIAQRLQAAVRSVDTVARLGGDEFVVVADGDDLPALLPRVRDAVEAPIAWEGLRLQVGASLGVAEFPRDGTSCDALLAHADQAMYAAKQRKPGPTPRS